MGGSFRGAAFGLIAALMIGVTGFVMGYRHRGAEFDADLEALKRQAQYDNQMKNDAINALARELAEAERAAESVAQVRDNDWLATIEATRVANPGQPLAASDIAAINKMIREASR